MTSGEGKAVRGPEGPGVNKNPTERLHGVSGPGEKQVRPEGPRRGQRRVWRAQKAKREKFKQTPRSEEPRAQVTKPGI